jgi:hypothetical protein
MPHDNAYADERHRPTAGHARTLPSRSASTAPIAGYRGRRVADIDRRGPRPRASSATRPSGPRFRTARRNASNPAMRLLNTAESARRSRATIGEIEPGTDPPYPSRISHAHSMPRAKRTPEDVRRRVAEEPGHPGLAGCSENRSRSAINRSWRTASLRLEAGATRVKDRPKPPIAARNAISSFDRGDPGPFCRRQRSSTVSLPEKALDLVLNALAVGDVLRLVHGGNVGDGRGRRQH